jgi:hypothetical protein
MRVPSVHSTLALLGAAVCLAVAGCGDGTPGPVFIGGEHYAIVTTNIAVADGPRTGTEMLFYYSEGAHGPSEAIWPAPTIERVVVFDRLAIFNGGKSSDVIWRLYPALFACNAGGTPVEISQPACRQLPGWKAEWTNYAFAVMGTSNNQVRLDASERLPLFPDRPRRIEVLMDKDTILKAVAEAQGDTNVQYFNGKPFRSAR